MKSANHFHNKTSSSQPSEHYVAETFYFLFHSSRSWNSRSTSSRYGCR